MAKQYYNTFEFNRFKSIKNTNPLEAKILIEDYIKKYPKDYVAWAHYVDLLVSIGNIEKATKELKLIEELSKNDGHFRSEFNRVKKLETHLIFSKIKLLFYQGKYDELYKFYLLNKHMLMDIDFSHVIYYCKTKLGLSLDKQRTQKSYLFRQIYEYNEEELLEHIKEHGADYNRDLDNQKQGIFVPDFPFEEVLTEIKKYIPSEKRLFFGLIEDTYVFKYDGCGRDNNKLQDYIKVICFHDTDKIITMFPVKGVEFLPMVDLNYLVSKEETKLIRRRSQIDKFNMKYGNR